MSNFVIVAIPAQDDYVWQVSSEKVPHITLCFLGDADTNPNSQEIVDFVEHAATTMSPFYMDVDYRGVLGPDEADVIFFEKGWDYKAVSNFRDHLLTNTYIKQAYNSTEQYPEWTPHLTLGYPATPARTPDNEHHIYSVSFDRIGVWFGDFDGPEFRLEKKAYDMPGISMSSMTRAEAEELLHFGIKGMRWGFRSEPVVTTAVTATTGHTKKGKAVVETKGGTKQPAHPDAIAARIAGQKLKKSGVVALSNKDIEQLAKRIDLEKRIDTLTAKPESPSHKFIRDLLGVTAKQQTQRVVNLHATRQVDKMMKGKGA